MHVHIGKKIEERMKELRMSPAFLAEKINTTRQNIYGIFRRKSIDTDLLLKISDVLDHDFFALYRRDTPGAERYATRDELEDLMLLVNDLQVQYRSLKKQLTMQKKKL